ncbi:MAG: hypothetical protein GF401_04890 [Chitinivibrionales bacterium]|nr:hypothetical protein [Chitinivibrionales bacterium]
MKRIIIGIMAGFILLGCSGENEISIHNNADGGITFHFRGERYPVAAGAQFPITDIPNGTFEYSTVVAVPPGPEKVNQKDGLSGSLTFYNQNTIYSIEYVSIYNLDIEVDTVLDQYDTTATYEIGAAVTSTHFR